MGDLRGLWESRTEVLIAPIRERSRMDTDMTPSDEPVEGWALEQVKSLARFPNENPHPVLRVRDDAMVLFANKPSAPLLEDWGGSVDTVIPDPLGSELIAVIAAGKPHTLEKPCRDRVFTISVVPVPDVRYANLYCQDITEQQEAEQRVRDLARFPDENPNPVMRLSEEGAVLYANESAGLILRVWKTRVADLVPADVRGVLQEAFREDESGHVEVVSAAAVHRLEIAPVRGAGYANVYGSDISRLKESERSLIEARDQALAATHAKSGFLANMSHELRTPLNAIIGYSEMLIEETQESGLNEFVSDLERVHAAGTHLLSLINDVLDLSKIEAGRMGVHLEHVDVADLIDHVGATIRPLAAQRSNELGIRVADEVMEIETDVTKLRQVLLNLVSNACKFTEEGMITLSVDPDELEGDPALRIEVVDTGIGMTESEAERVYEAFTQAKASMAKDYGGTGLGLTITKKFRRDVGWNHWHREHTGGGEHVHRRPPDARGAVFRTGSGVV